jgi:hypothetical protein
MKNLVVASFISVLILLLASPLTVSSPALTLQDCSCVAPDGSCSASILCQRGCIQHCASRGDCYAECSGFYETLGIRTTLELQNATYPQLVSALARISGKDIEFSPAKADAAFNTGWKRATLWDVLDMLSDRGTVQIAGKDFEKLKRLRKLLLSGDKISLCVRGTPVNTFVRDMASLTGLPLRITAGRPTGVVNLRLEHVTLDDILVKVANQTGTAIREGACCLAVPGDHVALSFLSEH